MKVTEGKTPAAVRRVHLTTGASETLRVRMDEFTGKKLFFRRMTLMGREPASRFDRSHLETITAPKMKFRLCDCRYTFATRVAESGTDLLVLSSILGHSNLKMVSRYAHPSEALKAEAVRRVGKDKQKPSRNENAAEKVIFLDAPHRFNAVSTGLTVKFNGT